MFCTHYTHTHTHKKKKQDTVTEIVCIPMPRNTPCKIPCNPSKPINIQGIHEISLAKSITSVSSVNIRMTDRRNINNNVANVLASITVKINEKLPIFRDILKSNAPM